MTSVEESTTIFDIPTDLPTTTEAVLSQDATTVTTSTKTSTTEAVTTTKKPSTAGVTTKVKTTQEDISTSKIVTTTKILGTSENPSSSTKSTTKSPPQVTTKQHVTSDKPVTTTKHTGLLTIKQKASSETSNIENGSTKGVDLFHVILNYGSVDQKENHLVPTSNACSMFFDIMFTPFKHTVHYEESNLVYYSGSNL